MTRALVAALACCLLACSEGASCRIEPAGHDPADPYPFCQYERASGWETYCAPTLDGWGYANWHTEPDGSGAPCEGTSCNTCLCHRACTRTVGLDAGGDVECPAPTSGTAEAECVLPRAGATTGTCLLFCAGGATCPDGMRCVRFSDRGGPADGALVCAWAPICEL